MTFGQVGINTADPESTFDIKAQNPSGISTRPEGLLIPRVDRERAQSMIGVKNSTLIYVDDATTGTQADTAQNINNPGYYYFNGTAWAKLDNEATLANNGDGTYTYISENGNTTSIKGNGTLSGTGIIQVNTGTNATDALFTNASISISGGTPGQVLTTNTSGQPYWNTHKNVLNIRRVNSNQAFNPLSDDVLLVDLIGMPSTGTVTITFSTHPLFRGTKGRVFTIKRVDDGPANLVIGGGIASGVVSIFDDTETQIVVPPKTTIQLLQESDDLTGFKFQTISKF
ncbi:hypothetical protein A0O34_07990 [Chryseobacterium glaciei]|uniref:Uncharacterized protein n=2 Tax=Chryseobacterium glaciei TaxID=1685010 RepID=A0A172XUE2_9FLAO|nr:hypothetical protein A0O34_07990 [Chryseobacterium glaciei]